MLDLDKIFNLYRSRYQKILNNFYPSLNSTGFQERNLTVNFSKAYETIYPNAITWFEFQIKQKEHIDSIIIDDFNHIIFLVESKRITSHKKINEIIDDINRINNVCKEKKLNGINSFKRERIPNISSYKIYGLILADIWLEEKWKKELYKTGLINEKEKIKFVSLKPLEKSLIANTTVENYRLLYYLFETNDRKEYENEIIKRYRFYKS